MDIVFFQTRLSFSWTVLRHNCLQSVSFNERERDGGRACSECRRAGGALKCRSSEEERRACRSVRTETETDRCGWHPRVANSQDATWKWISDPDGFSATHRPSTFNMSVLDREHLLWCAKAVLPSMEGAHLHREVQSVIYGLIYDCNIGECGTHCCTVVIRVLLPVSCRLTPPYFYGSLVWTIQVPGSNKVVVPSAVVGPFCVEFAGSPAPVCVLARFSATPANLADLLPLFSHLLTSGSKSFWVTLQSLFCFGFTALVMMSTLQILRPNQSLWRRSFSDRQKLFCNNVKRWRELILHPVQGNCDKLVDWNIPCFTFHFWCLSLSLVMIQQPSRTLIRMTNCGFEAMREKHMLGDLCFLI